MRVKHSCLINFTHTESACLTPPQRIEVSVTLNGQQYTTRTPTDVEHRETWWPSSSVPLVIYEPPIAENISPSSGPSLGGTRIAIAGVNFVNGSNYTCRFSDRGAKRPWNEADPSSTTLYGTFTDFAHVHCLSPPVVMRDCATISKACAVHPTRTTFLDIALNGQDYVPRGRGLSPLVRYRPPAIMSMSPNTGPSAGGTMLTLHGVHNLSGGSDYRCRFANRTLFLNSTYDQLNVSVAPDSVVNATVAATLDAATGFVRCVTPPLGEPDATLVTVVHVSLNGQQYHSASDALAAELSVDQSGEMAFGADSNFSYFGRPSVGSISPTCGPTAGHTKLTLTGTQLRGGSDYRCRFGEAPLLVNASTTAYVDDASGTVQCPTPPGMDSVPTLHLELSLNGQESTHDGTLVVRYKPPKIYSLSPSSGPVGGNTMIRVGGNHSIALRHGCDVRCKFAASVGESGALTVPGLLRPPDRADVVAGSGNIDCVSPSGSTASGPVEITLNGQQYSGSRVSFAAYSTPVLQVVSPPLGPSIGNTSLRLTVANLQAVGTDVRCRFGGKEEEEEGGVDVMATYDPYDRARYLNCTSPFDPPHQRRPLGVDQLRITLNGQQYSGALSYNVLIPPVVRSIYPLATPKGGAIVVTIHGEGFAIEDSATAADSDDQLEVSSGEAPMLNASSANDTGTGTSIQLDAANATNGTSVQGADTTLPPADPGLLRCRFGATSVVATLINHTAVTCTVPPAEASGLAMKRVIFFDDGMLVPRRDASGKVALVVRDANLSMVGDAIIRDGALKLTRSTPSQTGSFFFTAPVRAGQGVTSNGALPFPSAFRLSFQLTIGTGFLYEGPVEAREGGEGFSVSVGDLPDSPAGEYGVGSALRVSLRTRANLLTVEYGRRLVHSQPLPDAERLRSNRSFPVVLMLRNESLSLDLANNPVLVDHPLPEWRGDAMPSWRFGFGARTNHERGENHFVQQVILEVSPSLDPDAVAVSVTSNGQQYAPESAGVRLRYFGSPEPLLVEPLLGPARGGTDVIVRGGELHGGSAYRCRFGTHIVHATFEASDRSVRCVTPPLRDALAQLLLSTSGNASDDNSTMAQQQQQGLAHAARIASGDESGFYNVKLALSINEQDYERAIPSTLTFGYYAHVRVLAVSPQAGPVRGDTLVTLVVSGFPAPAAGLPAGAVPECRFSDVIDAVEAALGNMSAAQPYLVTGAKLNTADSQEDGDASGRVLTCTTPPATAGSIPLYVSLNQQDYRADGANNFTFYEVASVSSMLPSGGPRHGGTLVDVRGHGLAPAQVSREPALCRFGVSVVNATVDSGAGVLRCVAPPASETEGEARVFLTTAEAGGPTAKLHCHAAECSLSGTAGINVSDHVLRLTHTVQQEVGQLTITPRVTPPQLALTSWNLTVEALSDSAGGLSLSVGDVPSAGVGAAGGGAGLRLVFAPLLHRLTVTYRAETLRTVTLTGIAPPPSICNVPYADGCLRGLTVHADGTVDASQPVLGGHLGTWHTLHVAYREDGLHVLFNRAHVINALTLPQYSPQPGWRLVLAASSGEYRSRHLLRKLKLETDAALLEASLPVALSLNGQQFTPPGEGVGVYRYVAHPHVLTVEPASGPVAGGTRVLVSGLVFDQLASLHRCRFGSQAVDATLHEASGFLACTSPPVAASANLSITEFSIELTRDGQLVASDAHGFGHFAYHAFRTQQRTLHPSSAPVRGGTELHFLGVALGAGSAPLCRFDLRGLNVPARETATMLLADDALLASAIGFNASVSVRPAVTVPARYNESDGALSCTSPKVQLTEAQMVTAHGAALPVAISLNGQQFAPWHEPPLRLYEQPRLELVSPACGPVHGGTRLTLAGAYLHGGSDYRCQFGGRGLPRHDDKLFASLFAGSRHGDAGSRIFDAAVSDVPANYSSTPQGDTVLCTTPGNTFVSTDGLSRWSVGFAVALNGQQYASLQGAATAPGTAPTFPPRRGFGLYVDPDQAGGTHIHSDEVPGGRGGDVTIYGGGLHGGCAYACRFGDDVSPGNYDERHGGLRCRAPSRPAGTVESVWISLNGQQFVPLDLNFTWV